MLNISQHFEECLSKEELVEIQQLNTPFTIQQFLDRIPYRNEDNNYCALQALRERRAHCFDGGLLGAVLLNRLGYSPVIVNLYAQEDDEHILAIYRRGKYIGAVAKSNTVGLRFREPIYRDLRELVMSYFEFYFNLEGLKSLRSYTRMINLEKFVKYDWMCSNVYTEKIAKKISTYIRIPLLTQHDIEALSLVDQRLFEAGLMGSDPDGLYDPKKHR